MRTNNKCAAVRLEKSKLVAALAILAVAFVVIAAVPAVDAETTATTKVAKVGDTQYDKVAVTIQNPSFNPSFDFTILPCRRI